MSRPDPSLAPSTNIVVSYDTDVDGAAEALLVILSSPPQLDDSTRDDAPQESEDTAN